MHADAAPISVTVPGIVPPLKQPTSMTCWATVATMMYSWKKSTSMDIQTVMTAAGPQYLAQFNSNIGLKGSDKPKFLSTLGLKSEAPRNYTIDGWGQLLRQHGPVWVTTDEGTNGLFAIHARVLTAVQGDGTANGTSFGIVDPADGLVHTETVAEFVRKFEQVARDDMGIGADLRPQVVHF
ncbi:papain-like cysteine protease family protein [Delftia acidovorans]|uniref:papain-like cysteine protease family protein n=1 Tax=Delftia acidovorans TaxID=80866 RepID=UPI000F4C979F|nr:papain-like cysteine protease family protein [Delftia acidovorans]